MFIDYLWGIETSLRRNGTGCHRKRFIDYLWGIETLPPLFQKGHSKAVYRLPMRNWNEDEEVREVVGRAVYRLPMRNWNEDEEVREVVGRAVYRLPMRNWNLLNLLLLV